MTSPDDLPPVEFVPVSDEEALADIGEISLYNATSVSVAFFSLLIDDNGPQVDELRQLVTPESLPAWGDFIDAADAVRGYAITTRPNVPLGDDMQPRDDVRYAKLVPDPGAPLHAVTDAIVAAKIITLQRRPDYGGRWLVHALGGYVRPEELPRVT